MRRIPAAVAILAFAAFLPVAAQQPLPPPTLEPIPDAPQQQIGVDEQLAAEAGVTLRPGDRVERLTLDGQQYIVVHTSAGTTYHLMEAVPGWQPFAGADMADPGVRVPMWSIFEW
jgi:hypothetical protein